MKLMIDIYDNIKKYESMKEFESEEEKIETQKTIEEIKKKLHENCKKICVKPDKLLCFACELRKQDYY